jgi:recombination protein RecT
MSESKQLTTLDQRVSTIGRYINTDAFQRQLQLALPHGAAAPRFARLVLNEVRRNPKLAECTIESLLGVAMACAQTGLEPGPQGLCYIIPYKREATYQLGYKGMLNLAWRSEGIIGVASEVGRENDPVFEFDEGSSAFVRFQRLLRGERGNRVAAFAALTTKGGGTITRVMTYDEIEDHRRQYSKDKRDESAWATAWDEQACKTVLKKCAKRAPVSTETHQAMEWDGLAESGKPQQLGTQITIAEPVGLWRCLDCNTRDEYTIPFDGPCTNCGVSLLIPADAEIDAETNEIIPPEDVS